MTGHTDPTLDELQAAMDAAGDAYDAAIAAHRAVGWVKAARMMRDQDPRTPQGGGVSTNPPTGGPAVAT